MNWYAIRTVYLFKAREDGTNVFEERVVCFEAETDTVAHEKGYAERLQYESENGFTAYPEQIGYMQDGDDLIDGYELWSQLFESPDSLEEFYRKRYTAFEYHPR